MQRNCGWPSGWQERRFRRSRFINPTFAPKRNPKRAPGSAPYELLRDIGRGGMATVWIAAEQQPIKRNVATKVIRPEFAVGKMLVRGTEAYAKTACG